MANKNIERCSISSVIRALQIKIIMSCPYIPVSIAKIQNTATTNADKDVGQQKPPFITDRNAK